MMSLVTTLHTRTTITYGMDFDILIRTLIHNYPVFKLLKPFCPTFFGSKTTPQSFVLLPFSNPQESLSTSTTLV